MRYLDSRADLTFKRVFGEHPDLVMSLLNALLPLTPDQEITEIEYLPSEIVPDNLLRKNSIVDVRASKAYVRQLGVSEEYELLQPGYSLNLVNDIFEPNIKEYYHDYRLVHEETLEKIIDGLQLILVELPKFALHNYLEKKMLVLWLRFLTEIDEKTRQVPEELLANPEVKKAVTALEESAFTDAQLAGYEKFWDIISVEKTLYNSAECRGLAAGRKEGIEQGMERKISRTASYYQ